MTTLEALAGKTCDDCKLLKDCNKKKELCENFEQKSAHDKLMGDIERAAKAIYGQTNRGAPSHILVPSRLLEIDGDKIKVNVEYFKEKKN